MTDREQERWMAVLAGQAEPDDPDTDAAAALRQALLPEDNDMDTTLDDAATRRILNMLEARGAFSVDALAQPDARSQSAAAQPGWLERVRQWLASGSAGYVSVAAVMAALLVVPVLMERPADPVSGDDTYTKRLSGLGESTVIHSAEPALAASQLIAVLRQSGLEPRQMVEGTAQWVTAKVPAERREPVAQALMELGLDLPPSGELSVRFVQTPVSKEGAP